MSFTYFLILRNTNTSRPADTINKISETEFDYTMINSYSQYDSSEWNVYRKIFNAFENFNYINKSKAKISNMECCLISTVDRIISIIR